MNTVALCTTIYPAAMRFLADFWRSVADLSETGFDLVVGLDQVTPAEATAKAPAECRVAEWIEGRPGETPATIRQRVLAALVERHGSAVLVDADDVLHAGRVAEAVKLLSSSDLTACALRLVGPDGTPLGGQFTLPAAALAEDILPRHNVFGLSNTAYRCEMLRRCLPIPAEVELVDWFLATQAWLLGARLSFDRTPHMDYRQHDANMTCIMGPFSAERIARDTVRVQRHFRQVREARRPGRLAEREARLAAVAADVDAFAARVVQVPRLLEEYAARLAELAPAPRWWIHVAHADCAQMWREKG